MKEDEEFNLLVEDPASMYCGEQYLAEHGPRNAMEVSRETGVNLPTIQKLLREGRLEAMDGDTVYQLWAK